jgi:hypothetical protein
MVAFKKEVKDKETKSDRQSIEFYSSEESPHGFTFGAWTVRWWKWCFSIPRKRNPTVDETGIHAAEKQTLPTWFLAGTWVKEERSYPHRKCYIPEGASILFPLINCEENPLEYPDLKSKSDMSNRLSYDMGTVHNLECFVDDEEMVPQRVRSDPEFFEIRIRSDMSENKLGGSTRMTTDGYWIYLKPLSKGTHHIEFEGSYQHGRLYSGATYDLLVF